MTACSASTLLRLAWCQDVNVSKKLRNVTHDPALLYYHTHSCTSIFVRTLADIMHPLNPSPTLNHHNLIPNPNINLHLTVTYLYLKAESWPSKRPLTKCQNVLTLLLHVCGPHYAVSTRTHTHIHLLLFPSLPLNVRFQSCSANYSIPV